MIPDTNDPRSKAERLILAHEHMQALFPALVAPDAMADAVDVCRAYLATLEELALWRPLTHEEAQKAYDEAEAVPMSREEMADLERLVKIADSSVSTTERLTAEIERRIAESKQLILSLKNCLLLAGKMQRKVGPNMEMIDG